MTRPALPMPDWATDDTYTSGPDNTLPTKLQPIAGEFSQGWVRTGRVPARKLNWLLNKLGAWTEYFATYMLDGGQGGTYSPLFPIVIGGCPFSLQVTQGISVIGGMNVFGSNQFHDAAAFSSAVTMTSSLNVADTATFSSTALFSGFAQFDSAAIFNGAISAFNSTFLHDVTVSSDATFNGTATFHGPVTIAGANMTSDANCSLTDLDVFGSAKFHTGIINRVASAGADADATFSVSTADRVMMPGNSILSAARTWTIDDVGAVDGREMELSRILETSAHTVNVKRADGSYIVALDPPGGGVNAAAKIVRQGGTWKLFSRGV